MIGGWKKRCKSLRRGNKTWGGLLFFCNNQLGPDKHAAWHQWGIKCSNRIYFFDFARRFQIVQGEEIYLVILNFCSFLALNSQGETLPQICEKKFGQKLFYPWILFYKFWQTGQPTRQEWRGEYIYVKTFESVIIFITRRCSDMIMFLNIKSW